MLYVEIDDRKLQKALKFAPRHLRREMGDKFDHIRKKFFKTFRAKRLQGPPGIRGTTHGIWKRIRSADINPMGDINNMGITIWTESKIARLHEEGGVVQGKGGGLAVPLSARTKMFTARGALRKRYKRPSALRNVRLVVLKGKKFLVKYTKRTGAIEPLYVIKRSVRIRPRLEFIKTWQDMENWSIEQLNKGIQRAIDKI